VLLSLAQCGEDARKDASGNAPAAGNSTPTADDGIDQANRMLQEELPRPLTAADVETVLRLSPLVDDGGIEYATAARRTGVKMPEREWGVVSARVAMAYADLLLAENDVAHETRVPQLKADIEVVRPFKKRLDQMDEERRAKKGR
jgi:hypothetical protein